MNELDEPERKANATELLKRIWRPPFGGGLLQERRLADDRRVWQVTGKDSAHSGITNAPPRNPTGQST